MTHLADKLNDTWDGTSMAEWADEHSLVYDTDRLGRITLLTDGIEAARVVFSTTGTRCDEIDRFVSCAVPDWAPGCF